MVCSVHWYGYLFLDGNCLGLQEFISFYNDYCLYHKYPNCTQYGDYHAMVDGFGAMVNCATNRFKFLPHDFEFMWFS